MAVLYRLTLSVPATKKKQAFTLTLTEQDQRVQSIEVQLVKEKKKISNLTCHLADIDGKVFSEIPDPAFFDVTCSFAFTKPNSQQPEEVFKGKVTSLGFKWGQALTTLDIVAKDKTIDMSRAAKIRTYKGQTVRQIVDALAKEYDIPVDWDLGEVQLATRAIEFGVAGWGRESLSDWAFVRRMLDSVGLKAHFEKGKIKVSQTGKKANTYPTVFKPGDGIVIEIDATINHVRSPGDLGNLKTNPAFDSTGKDKATSGNAATESSLTKGGEATTYKKPIGGANSTKNIPHTEDNSANQWSNIVTGRRGRKDEGTLTLNPTPGIFPSMLVELSGWSGKVDGHWEVHEVKHSPVGEQPQTVVSLTRGTSTAGGNTAGSPAFDYK